MSLDGDLLKLARRLARLEKGKPKQSSLRRAVSTLYYAAFHMLIRDAVKLASPSTPNGLRRLVGRAFDHGRMKSVCIAFSQASIQNLPKPIQSLIGSPIEPELAAVAQLFAALQEQRLAADYDLSARFSRLDVLPLVRRARRRFKDWDGVRTNDNSKVFLMTLLLNGHWNR